MAIAYRKSTLDQRADVRMPYSGNIFFVAKDGINEGRLKDYSRSGLFIITKARLSIGEIITVAIPYAKDQMIKCRGRILRQDKDGFGIELIRERSQTNLRIVK
jgi:hypothetical protein